MTFWPRFHTSRNYPRNQVEKTNFYIVPTVGQRQVSTSRTTASEEGPSKSNCLRPRLAARPWPRLTRWGEGLKTMKIIDQTFQVIPQSSSVTSKTQRKNCPTMIPGSYPNSSQNHPNRSQRAPKRHLKGTVGEALDPKPTNTR